MTEVPKIVHDRLRAVWSNQAGTEGLHPDADVLTAFVEQALSATEREGVLEHLARCGDCRELVALAFPAMDTMTAPTVAEAERARVSAPRKISFARPSMRWAALVAGVVVAAAVLLMHPGKLNQVASPSADRKATAAPPVASSQIASAPLASPPMNQSALSAKADAGRAKSELQSKKLKAGQVAAPSLQAQSGILLAESKVAANKKDLKEADKLSAGSSAGARALSSNAPAVPEASQTVEVTAEYPTVQAEVSSEAAQNGAPAIAKAKPASRTGTSQPQNAFATSAGEVPLQGRNVMSMAKLAATPSPIRARNVTWTITAGILQRSLDSGQSWQTALHADHSLLCYASHDQNIWTGGQAGTLFHSADSGLTWSQVQPSIKSQPLTSDITHIDVPASSEVVISTSSNEIWSSADNGKTWNKK